MSSFLLNMTNLEKQKFYFNLDIVMSFDGSEMLSINKITESNVYSIVLI